MSNKFKGVYPVVVTPFKKDGSFDIQASKAHLDHMLESGVHGVCVFGATGEYQSVTLDEHKSYVQKIVPYIKNSKNPVPVIVGVTREMPDEAAILARNAFECGADAVMILPTYYCHPAQDEIYSYYKYIADHVNGGTIMVYNNPASAGVEIEQDTFKRLMELDQVQIAKESSGNIRKLTEVINDSHGNAAIFCGWDNMAYESFICGATGWICMLANLAPKQCVALFEAVYTEKDFAKAKTIYDEILPGLSALESVAKPVQAIKYVLDRQGYVGGYSRRPRLPLTDVEKQEVEALFDLNVLY